jgi:uncharacterized damage-inducible protein DinB
MSVYDGWDSHQLALTRAIDPLTPEQLAWQAAPNLSSVGAIISHLALARLYWFHQMGAPGSAVLARQIAPWTGEQLNAADPDELQRWIVALVKLETALEDDPIELRRWLAESWQMIETTLTTWTVADLTQTYRRRYQGKLYEVSRQWTIWRILSHDLHHGGEVAILLGLQGIDIPDLGDRGGHLTDLTLIEPA